MSPELSVSFSPANMAVEMQGRTVNVDFGQNERVPVPGPAGPGLPSGGEVGQIIKKSGPEDYETDWYDYPSIAPGTDADGYALRYGRVDLNEASGAFSLAGGRDVKATGQAAVAIGRGAIASGAVSFATGYNTKATGQAAHAEGQVTEASGTDAHAEGYKAKAIGTMSHAEGNETTASGYASHAEGVVTVANHRGQHVFGIYNIPDDSPNPATSRGNYVEIVGNGDSVPSNARTLDWNGNEVLSGKLTVGAAPSGSMDAATKGYVDGEISSLDAEDVGLTVITALEIAAILQS